MDEGKFGSPRRWQSFQTFQKGKTSAAAMPLNVSFLDRESLPDEIELKPLSFEHVLKLYDRTASEDVAARIKDTDIVITNKVPIRTDIIASSPRLKLIAVAATGTDMIDLPACNAYGVAVSNIRNYAVNTVPEHTFAMILALRRSIIAYRESVKAGRWQESKQFCYFDHPIRDLAGATLGIIGDGVLGQSVADVAKAFGMKVLFASYKGTSGMGPLYTPFDDVMRLADVITLHAPLLPSTRNLIGTREFALMARHPLLINTARGGLVDEEALRDALSSGQIAGAGFDVVTEEPPPIRHVMMKLLEMPNFILTPHVAWASREAIQSLADQLMENIELFVRGTPRNIV